MKSLKQQFTKYDKSIEKTVPQYSALLGKTPTIVEHPTRNGFCYARMADNLNELIVVFNDKVSQAYNLPVLISRRGNTWYVVGRDTQRYNDWGSDSSFLPKHARQHEFNRDVGSGADAVFIYPDQFTPLLVYPSGTSGAGNVMIAPYLLQRTNDFIYVGNTGTGNLLIYKPTNNQGIMGLVYLDKTTGNPGFLIASGTPFAGSITGTSAITPYLPYPSTNQEPLYFVRLVSGTSAIKWENLYNARQFIGGSTSTGSASDHESLTGLLGGSANNHYHLTPSQVIGLVSGTPTSMHSHTGTVSSFITGSVPFAGSDGNLKEANPNFRWDETLRGLRLGPPPLASIFNFADLYPVLITAKNQNETAINAISVYGTGSFGIPTPQFSGYRSRGTLSTPLPVQTDDIILSQNGSGYDGSTFKSATRFLSVANANWITGSNAASRFDWQLVPSGSYTRRLAASLYEDSFNLISGTYNINGSPHTHAGGSGDVVGPAVAVSGDIVGFDGTTGKLVKDLGTSNAVVSAMIEASTHDANPVALDKVPFRAVVNGNIRHVFFEEFVLRSFGSLYTTAGTSTAYTVTTTVAIPYISGERFHVIFHTTAGASPTINRDALGAKPLVYFDSAGAKIACGPTTIISGMRSDLVYDGTSFIVLDALPPSLLVAIPVSGWTEVSDTWTYASANTITVPSGAAAIYEKGTKIRLKQGAGYKYYYIIGVADTLLTVTGGSDYTVANAAITDKAYSTVANPTGHPITFALGTPTWTTNGTPFTNQPPTNAYKFSLVGKTIVLSGGSTMHATSGGTGAFTATFPSGQLPVSESSTAGSMVNVSNGVGGWVYVGTGGNAPQMATSVNGTPATNSQAIVWSVTWNI